MRSTKVFLALCVVMLPASAALAGPDEFPSVPSFRGSKDPEVATILVHGLTWGSKEDRTWGWPVREAAGVVRWNGMVGFLESQGFPFGGVIRPRSGQEEFVPACLDTTGVRGDSKKANVFVLAFSPGARTDGLAYKTLELARCVKWVKAYTGARTVRIVAYSAGGLVARAYVQSALPGVEFAADVDTVITIASPHLGAEMASTRKFGIILGVAATSLSPEAQLVYELNERLPLPHGVRFVSIVIRGFGADVRGDGRAYNHLVDQNQLANLPVCFRKGGDQVIHVRSQNLGLAKCALAYETATKTPIHSILVRVADPSPRDKQPFEEKVHDAAPFDPAVQSWVSTFLQNNDGFWKGLNKDERDSWIDHQIRQCAFGMIEDCALTRHKASEVTAVRIAQINDFGTKAGPTRDLRFSGSATTKGRILRVTTHSTRVEGEMSLSFDEFGRLRSCRGQIAKVEDK